jgi:hypothetical protein
MMAQERQDHDKVRRAGRLAMIKQSKEKNNQNTLELKTLDDKCNKDLLQQ